jgi:hypothetical protein
MFKASIHNIIRKQPAPTIIKDRVDDTLLWGAANAKPFEIVTTINRSITGSACIRTFSQYLYGNGFMSESLASAKVNSTLTFDGLLRSITSPFTKFSGFAFNVKYNAEFKIRLIYPMPFESLRLGIPDEEGNISHLVYNPYFGTAEYDKKYNQVFDTFNPDPRIVQDQVLRDGKGYKGQIFWFGLESEYNRFYPLPYWYSDNHGKGGGKDAMENEYLLSRLLNKELDHGFLQNVLMKVVGDPDEPIKISADSASREVYRTAGELLSEQINSKFAGVDGDNMMILWSAMKEQFPEIQAFPSNFNYEKLKDVADKIKQDIASSLQIPLILAGIQTSGSLSKDDIESAVQLMYSNVRFYQSILEDTFRTILTYWHDMTLAGESTDIQNYNPFPESKSVDPIIWAEMSKTDRANWINENTEYTVTTSSTTDSSATNESENPEQAAAQAQLRGSVGGVQGILQIADNFKKGIINDVAAITILQEIFGFDEAIARNILGL